MTAFNPEPILPSEDERSDLAKLEQILNRLNNGQHGQPLQITNPETGEAIQLPDSLVNLLRQSLHQFNQGKGVMVETFHQPLTTSEAAYLLNFSRQHLVQLLQNGEIPSTGEGLDRRIEFEDLMAYKKKWEHLRHQAIEDIAQMSSDAGLYFMTSDISETAKQM
jgi:excisionase family DNA binding protein